MLTDWETRMVDEFWNTKDRYDKLHHMLIKWEAGTLDFKPKCPKALLRDQLDTMRHYLEVLAIRAEIEGIDLYNTR